MPPLKNTNGLCGRATKHELHTVRRARSFMGVPNFVWGDASHHHRWSALRASCVNMPTSILHHPTCPLHSVNKIFSLYDKWPFTPDFKQPLHIVVHMSVKNHPSHLSWYLWGMKNGSWGSLQMKFCSEPQFGLGWLGCVVRCPLKGCSRGASHNGWMQPLCKFLFYLWEPLKGMCQSTSETARVDIINTHQINMMDQDH